MNQTFVAGAARRGGCPLGWVVSGEGRVAKSEADEIEQDEEREMARLKKLAVEGSQERWMRGSKQNVDKEERGIRNGADELEQDEKREK